MASSVFATFGVFNVSGGALNLDPSLTALVLPSATSLLAFGGLTSSQFAIRGNGAIESIKADASAFANHSASAIAFSGNQGFMTTTSNGKFVMENAAATAGGGFDVTTDSLVLVRNRTHSAYATVDTLGLKASGSAGASASGAVASLTTVNGIVTAQS